MKIDAQIVRDAEGKYKIALRVVTTNEIDVSHTKFIELADNAFDSLFSMALPFTFEFEDVTATSGDESIAKVREQQAAAIAQAAAEEAAKATPVAVEGELV